MRISALTTLVFIGLVGCGGNDHDAISEMPLEPEASPPEKTIGEWFVDNEDGTVTDQRTGIQWMRCDIGQTWTGRGCRDTPRGEKNSFGFTKDGGFYDARDNVRELNFAGHDDWRLPSYRQLKTIVYCSSGRPDFYPDRSQGECAGDYSSPTIDTSVFPNAYAGWFWTTTDCPREWGGGQHCKAFVNFRNSGPWAGSLGTLGRARAMRR